MTALLPSERQQFSRNILPRRESFEVLYHLHFDNLCADFQEDIRFKFSLGFTALMKKFMTMGKKQKYDMYGNNVPRGLGSPGSPQTPTNEYTQPQDDWSLMSKVAIGALTSQGNLNNYFNPHVSLYICRWSFTLLNFQFLQLYHKISLIKVAWFMSRVKNILYGHLISLGSMRQGKAGLRKL